MVRCFFVRVGVLSFRRFDFLVYMVVGGRVRVMGRVGCC